MSDLAREIDSLPRRNLRDRITSAPKLEPVEHPSGEIVYAREMTARDFRAWQEASGSRVVTTKGGKPAVDTGEMAVDEAMCVLALRTMTDEHGERLFGDDEMDVVRDQPLAFLLSFTAVSMQLSGLSDKDKSEGNSGSAPPADSS